jgi:hypothetical protein
MSTAAADRCSARSHVSILRQKKYGWPLLSIDVRQTAADRAISILPKQFLTSMNRTVHRTTQLKHIRPAKDSVNAYRNDWQRLCWARVRGVLR